jgi:hypothetical protein
LIVSLALLALLFAGMLYDLRDHEVPMTITAGGLIVAGLYSLTKGLWAPVLLLIALILVSEFELRVKQANPTGFLWTCGVYCKEQGESIYQLIF